MEGKDALLAALQRKGSRLAKLTQKTLPKLLDPPQRCINLVFTVDISSLAGRDLLCIAGEKFMEMFDDEMSRRLAKQEVQNKVLEVVNPSDSSTQNDTDTGSPSLENASLSLQAALR